MNNPYDPRTGMTRGYSTPFFMDALRYQTQVPASIGQRKVNHFFGDYLSYLKPVEELYPLTTKEDFLWDINKEQLFKSKTYSNPNTYYNTPKVEPPSDTTYNMPQSVFGNKEEKKELEYYYEVQKAIKENNARKNTIPSRQHYIPDDESNEKRIYLKWLSQNQREF
jgi:hypothetical protein